MHLSSLEVRWFWKGEVETHPGLKSVFERFEPIEKRSDVQDVRWSKARDDVYLIVPSAEDLGIKWREGELQTKGRRAILGSMVFGDRLRGVVEQWTKWSHEGPDVIPPSSPCSLPATQRRRSQCGNIARFAKCDWTHSGTPRRCRIRNTSTAV